MRSHFICSGLMVVIACAATGVGRAAQVVGASNSQCMTVPEHGGVVPDGTIVRLIECRGQNNQQWSVSNGVMSGFAGVCLDVQGSNAANGAQVIGVACSGAPSQQWAITNGQIVGIGGKCLDVSAGNGFRAPLVLAVCSSAPSQQWSLN